MLFIWSMLRFEVRTSARDAHSCTPIERSTRPSEQERDGEREKSLSTLCTSHSFGVKTSGCEEILQSNLLIDADFTTCGMLQPANRAFEREREKDISTETLYSVHLFVEISSFRSWANCGKKFLLKVRCCCWNSSEFRLNLMEIAWAFECRTSMEIFPSNRPKCHWTHKNRPYIF